MLIAQVSGTNLTGNVVFREGLIERGRISVDASGQATLTLPPGDAGMRQYTAEYQGDATHAPSLSAPVRFTIAIAPILVSITAPQPNTTVSWPAKEVFCRRLKTARLAAGLSQKQLGIRAGIDEFVASTRINRYELGIHETDLATAQRLADVLKIPLAYLFANSDDLADLILRFPDLTQKQRKAILEIAQGGTVSVT